MTAGAAPVGGHHMTADGALGQGGAVTTVSLVGSTGSIGTQAADVLGSDPERYRVVAIGARRSVATLAEQARALRPEVVAVADPAAAVELKEQLPAGTELLAGPGALTAIATAADVEIGRAHV